MTDHLGTIVSVAIHRSGVSPVIGEGVTQVKIEDLGGGPFIVLEQRDTESCRNGRVSFELDELRAALREAEKLMQQDGLRHD